ncbi:MAG TPA: beta-ketoacyl synthase N-terminal-like domain-containing protein [Kofleriaceae bacterium]|nr:beta-ketoacyl synthase N-terminal-like domain-containing protein [Kofleriaceae bacterium]
MTAAILGWALRTPLGDTVDRVCDRLLAGESAGRSSPLFDQSTYPCRLGAAIPDAPPPSRHGRFLDRLALHAVAVAGEALHMAQAEVEPPRLGLFAAIGGLRVRWDDMRVAFADQQADGAGAWERGFKRLHPFLMLKHLSNNAHALLAADVAAMGEGVTFGGAVAAAEAIAAADRALAADAVDAALVVAYDSLLEPETLIALGSAGILCAGERAAAPYGDAAASGAVPGEAAAALVLVRPGDAGRRLLGRVTAATAADGGPGEPGADAIGRAAARMIRHDAGLRIGAIDGAGRALALLDAAEREALLAAGASSDTPLACLQAATGRLGAATAAVQAIAWARLLARRTLPPIAGLTAPAGGPLDPLAAPQPAPHGVLAISTGAPGLAAALFIEDAR